MLPERWNLSHLLEQPDKNFETLMNDLDRQVAQFETWRPRLHADMDERSFFDVLRHSEEIATDSAKLSAYSYLWFSEDTKVLEARSFKAKVEERLTSLQNRILFFDLWWQSVDEPNAARLQAAAGDFSYHLDTIRRFKNHTLSEPEEKLINLKNVTGRQAINTLYDVLTNGLTFELTVSGKTKRLTREQLSAYVRSPDPKIRKASYKELYRVFEANHDVIGEIYISLVQDWKAENIALRRFPTPIAARNLANDVPDAAVEALLKTCEKNVNVFQEYFSLKGRINKIKSMNRYHIYAPHKAERKRYRYSDAVRMVLGAYKTFSPTMAELAERVFAEHHIDARARPGKLSGAYCYSVIPGFTPYVLLNYTGEARDVATLAHELGHAIHGMMAAHHSTFTFHSTLPLAETASVFGERVLSEALIAEERDKAVKQGLLIGQLDDIYATVMRQAYFVRFEKAAHSMLADGANMKDLASDYLGSLRQQFGKTVSVPEEFRWEWLTIPHIFSSPFYCYAYSFGNLLVLSLFHQYKQEGEGFVPKYHDLLSLGGSKSPEAILSQVEVDIRSEQFWQSGFDTIKNMVLELEDTLT
jgi:oligoendopeptidase F